MMQKLKAFTLMELLIGMIISGVLISICYMSYTLINKQYLNYKTIKAELTEVLQFNSVLDRDIANAERMSFIESKLIINRKKKSDLEYNFEASFILRKEGEVTDTFRLISLNLIPSYLMSRGTMSENLLMSLSFDALVLGEQEHFQFRKSYDAETVVNADIQNFQHN